MRMVESNTEAYYRDMMDDAAGTADDEAPKGLADAGPAAPTPGGAADGLPRPDFWDAGMEREFRAGVKALLDDMTNKHLGAVSEQRRCEMAYEELTRTVNGAYRELTGKDLPSAMASNLDQLLMQITHAPLREPEHGPGLWASVPQHSLPLMVVARPLDLPGSPPREEIDLMMLHAIRMGRFLTTHYVEWAQTLPPCWIRHDDVVQEVYSLKCYADMIVASPNGGLYAPTLQSLIHSALLRVKGYLEASSANSSDHTHHMADTDLRQREQGRVGEYRSWFARKDGWSDEPGFDESWRFASADEGLESVCDLTTPTRADAEDTPTDASLLERVDGWRAHVAGLRGSYASHDGGDGRRFLDAAGDDERDIRRVWRDYRTREGDARDRLDRAVTSASLALRNQRHPAALGDAERRELNGMIDAGRDILRRDGKNMRDAGYRVRSIDMQERLAERIERLVNGDPAGVFDRCDRLLDDIESAIGRGGRTES